ncbi:MAG TPA: hypothetical protein VMB46_08745 [Methanomassiliicoccales archaeon]|nr:hypothetical protein [Methanomassiliicoccales archaeon]
MRKGPSVRALAASMLLTFILIASMMALAAPAAAAAISKPGFNLPGNVLVTDQFNNRVIEINHAGRIAWQYSAGINLAAFASRLPNGNTLITDSGNARIFEVTPQRNVAFTYFTNTSENSNPNPLPTNAVRLRDGGTMIADQFNHRVFKIDANKDIVWQYGMTNVVGNTPGLLNAPYTAFVIGDYTGQTVPPGTVFGVQMIPAD